MSNNSNKKPWQRIAVLIGAGIMILSAIALPFMR